MSELNNTQQTLIQLLSDGLCHSGTELGQFLGMSRSAIWKQINQLIELGIPIISLRQQGYRLKQGIILLNEEKIKNALQLVGCTIPLNVHLFNSIDSTNRYLKELPFDSKIDVCCAESQTQGRGRFGRNWHSPFGENIYFSSRWKWPCDLAKLSGLSLVTSLAVVASLKSFLDTSGIKIKWPNDLLWNDKKLCGILIEIIAESNANAQVIIGIGLNVNSDTEHQPLPDKPWCSLYELSQKNYDRNQLIACLIVNLNKYLIDFIDHDLQFFMEEWRSHDYLINKSITVTQSSESISGTAKGINSLGQLVLHDKQGKELVFSSGDTTLKAI